MKTIYLCLLLFLSSCSLFKKSDENYNKDSFVKNSNEYLLFLKEKSKEFKSNNRNKIRKLYKSEKRYLEILSREVTEPNKAFFKNRKDSKFTVIESNDPFYFSIPPNEIVLSSALLGNYIENENILAGIICYELIRLENHIYPRNIKVPLGVTDESDLIAITQIDRDDRVSLHKWSYRILKRTIFDTNTYLLWVQIVIRNIKKFKKHFAGFDNVLTEEREFKAFIIDEEKKEGTTFTLKKNERRVPKTFYSLVDRMKNAR